MAGFDSNLWVVWTSCLALATAPLSSLLFTRSGVWVAYAASSSHLWWTTIRVHIMKSSNGLNVLQLASHLICIKFLWENLGVNYATQMMSALWPPSSWSHGKREVRCSGCLFNSMLWLRWRLILSHCASAQPFGLSTVLVVRRSSCATSEGIQSEP